VVLLILTFGIRTQMSRYTLALYPAIAIVVAYFVLHALAHLRWGKHLVSLSGGIALALFVSHRDVLLSSNSDL
jgi:asparagine N-glycosylation enzyme membrane subunit Stt3